MASTTPPDMNRAPCQPAPSPETLAWQELQHACYALAGARGPQRKAAKQRLAAALERRQRLHEDRFECSGDCVLPRGARAE